MSIEQRLKEIRRESSSDAAGDPERFRRVALTEGEMMAQGAAIRETLAANAGPLAAIGGDLAERTIRRVVTVGCGDSWIAGHGVRPSLEAALGAPCEPVEAFDFATYGLHTIDAETVVIGLSSSGKTEPVIDGLTASAEKGAYTVGISNTLGSPLMTQCPGALHIRATRGGWPTQSSTAAMALMLAMGASVQAAKGGDASGLSAALDALPDQVDAVAQAFYEPARSVAKQLARVDLVLTTGAGPYFAPAEFGAAKLKELAPIHACSFPLEEYHHYRTQKPGDVMFMVAADAASHARALETAIMSRGSEGYCVALLPEGETEIASIVDVAWHLPPVAAATAPIVYSVPLHLFGYHAAVERDVRRACRGELRCRGCAACRPRRPPRGARKGAEPMPLTLFGDAKPVIAALHLPDFALNRHLSAAWYEDYALASARVFAEAGIPWIKLQDQTRTAGLATAETVARLAALARLIRAEVPGLGVGIIVEAHDPGAALAVVHAAGADFVRLKVFVGGAMTAQGPRTGLGAEAVAQRAALGRPDIALLADVHDRTAVPMSGESQPFAAEWAVKTGADGLIVTGQDFADTRARIAAVREAGIRRLVLIGGGVTAANVAGALEIADGVVVSSALMRRDAGPDDPVRWDADLCRRFMDAARVPA